MEVFGKIISPAVLIIAAIIMINAGVILYYAQHFAKSDEQLQNNVEKVQGIATQNTKILADAKHERDIRSDQACELFETDHLQDVQQLGQTYKYLASLTAEERQQSLNKFILINLPNTEQQALVDRAPEYCDGTFEGTGADIGLPEPDPVVPDRPAKLVRAIGPRPNYPSPVQKQKEGKVPKNGLPNLRNK